MDKYLTERKKFKTEYSTKNIISFVDHWPAYVGIKNLKKFLFFYNQFLIIMKLKGDIAEFGCWRGSNVMFFSKLIKIYNLKKKVFAFDSFDGIKTFNKKDGLKIKKYFGTYKGSETELKKLIKLYRLNNILKIQKGLIQETLPKFVKKNPDKKFSLLYYDADLYEPAKIMLDLLADKVVKGGIIMFDEWNFPDFEGETRAVNEFLKRNKKFKKIIPIEIDQPSLILKKIK